MAHPLHVLRRMRALPFGAGLAAALCAALASAAGAQSRFRVEVDRPAAAESTVDFRLIEVQGFAGQVRARGHDLVVVLDLSESTARDSGVDLDRDGPAGGTDPVFLRQLANRRAAPPGLVQRLRAGQDFEDSILAAELLAAQALIERLEPRRFRVGLVVFSDEARVVAPLGSTPARLREALVEIRGSFHRELRGTHLAAAIETARRALVPDAAAPATDRERSIVLLSDGAPTLPVHGDRAERFAVEEAGEAGLAGIRLFGFAIGPEGAAAVRVMGEMASLTGGRVERIEHPADTVARLRHLDLVDLAELAIVNTTTGVPARALRTFPDGSFDGFVELAPGRNHIRVRARSQSGQRRAVERLVTLSGEAPGNAAGSRAVLDELRRRTEEMRLWAEIEQHRRQQKKALEVEPLAPTARTGESTPAGP